MVIMLPCLSEERVDLICPCTVEREHHCLFVGHYRHVDFDAMDAHGPDEGARRGTVNGLLKIDCMSLNNPVDPRISTKHIILSSFT